MDNLTSSDLLAPRIIATQVIARFSNLKQESHIRRPDMISSLEFLGARFLAPEPIQNRYFPLYFFSP